MSDTPKSFRELAREMRESRAHTYASENADHYRGFDAGQIRAAEYVERLAGEWERFLREKDTNCSRIVLNQYCLLGEERR